LELEMALKNIKYKPGDVFAVPLAGGGFARGLAVLSSGDNAAFGHFWGPRIGRIEDCVIDSNLRPGTVIYTKMFSDLGLVGGIWKIMGQLTSYDPADWPMPDFIYQSDGKTWLRTYDDRTLSQVRNVMVDAESIDVAAYPKDGLAGRVFVERKLSSLIP
jgi:hypothetical protein